MDELFGRAQLSGELAERLTLLGGVEYARFMYGGDDAHYSNADLLNVEEGSPPSDTIVELGPFYEGILGQPVNDLKFFRYRDPDGAQTRAGVRSYEQLSPRLALVYAPLSFLSLKLQASRAFRAPAPSELFSTNSWMTDTDIDTLRPERVRTLEVSADWTPHRAVNSRTTLFLSRYENLIGYEQSELTNLFSRDTAGLELELMAEAELGARGRLMAFGSYTYVHLLAETDGDSGNRLSGGELTWAPAHMATAGVSYSLRHFTLALQGRYQGPVQHREGARLTPAFAEARPESVAGWVRFDMNARLQLNAWSSVGLTVTNLLDAESYLVRTGNFPFDYRMSGRRILGNVEIRL